MGCSPWGRWGSDTTKRLHFHFSLSYIGEGNGNPLQWSCLENPRDRGAWWAAVYGVAQSQTRLKQLSKSVQVLSKFIKNPREAASLVVQRITICLAMQGTLLVRFLVWEDATCLGATKPVCHNYRAFVLEPASCSPELALHKARHHSQKPAHRTRRVRKPWRKPLSNKESEQPK